MTPSPWKYFSLEELKCHCGKCGSTGLEMDNGFMLWLVGVRETCDFPFIIPSAYRCPAYNATVSSTGLTGPHTTGKAIDAACSGVQSMQLERVALNAGVQGKGCNQKGNGRFIHLDMCGADDNLPRPASWSY